MENNIKKQTISTNLMVRMAVVTALICVLSPFSIPIPFSPVPLSLANFVIFLSIFVLPPLPATGSICLYLLIGLVGLPVFSGFSGGLAKLLGPTGGYLIGYIPLVLIAGFIMRIGKNGRWYIFYLLGIILGETVLYSIGTWWLARSLQVSFTEGLAMGVFPYLPWDAFKIAVAMKVGYHLRKSLSASMGVDPIA